MDHRLVALRLARDAGANAGQRVAPLLRDRLSAIVALLGASIFGELPSPWTWVGAPVIIASGLVIVWREHRLHRRATLSAQAATTT